MELFESIPKPEPITDVSAPARSFQVKIFFRINERLNWKVDFKVVDEITTDEIT